MLRCNHHKRTYPPSVTLSFASSVLSKSIPPSFDTVRSYARAPVRKSPQGRVVVATSDSLPLSVTWTEYQPKPGEYIPWRSVYGRHTGTTECRGCEKRLSVDSLRIQAVGIYIPAFIVNKKTGEKIPNKLSQRGQPNHYSWCLNPECVIKSVSDKPPPGEPRIAWPKWEGKVAIHPELKKFQVEVTGIVWIDVAGVNAPLPTPDTPLPTPDASLQIPGTPLPTPVDTLIPGVTPAPDTAGSK